MNDTFEKLLNLSVQENANFIPKHENTTKSLKQFCKDTDYNLALPWWHGGCLVGKVVNPNYEVHGVRRLHVIDFSTFSQSPGTNPQAIVLMMGRYIRSEDSETHLRKSSWFIMVTNSQIVV